MAHLRLSMIGPWSNREIAGSDQKEGYIKGSSWLYRWLFRIRFLYLEWA